MRILFDKNKKRALNKALFLSNIIECIFYCAQSVTGSNPTGGVGP